MNADQLFTLFRNAGFKVETIANSNNILVFLDNRTVDTMEAQMLLGDRRNKIIKTGSKVMITPLTISIR